MTRERRQKSLRKVLDILSLSALKAAELFGTNSYKISYILRRQPASKTSLNQELALKIQAATGISAASLMRGDKVPVMLNGKPVNRESFQVWQGLEIGEESKEAQAAELSLKVRLLLDASGRKGNYLRRRTYHLLRSLLEEMRKAAGLSMMEIHQAGGIKSNRRIFSATREELDKMLGKVPAYQAVRAKLPAKGSIQVFEEIFPTWGDLPDDLMPEVLDSTTSEGRFYQLKVGDTWEQVFHLKFKPAEAP